MTDPGTVVTIFFENIDELLSSDYFKKYSARENFIQFSILDHTIYVEYSDGNYHDIGTVKNFINLPAFISSSKARSVINDFKEVFHTAALIHQEVDNIYKIRNQIQEYCSSNTNLIGDLIKRIDALEIIINSFSINSNTSNIDSSQDRRKKSIDETTNFISKLHHELEKFECDMYVEKDAECPIECWLNLETRHLQQLIYFIKEYHDRRI